MLLLLWGHGSIEHPNNLVTLKGMIASFTR